MRYVSVFHVLNIDRDRSRVKPHHAENRNSTFPPPFAVCPAERRGLSPLPVSSPDDLNSLAFGRPGSSPGAGTTLFLNGFSAFSRGAIVGPLGATHTGESLFLVLGLFCSGFAEQADVAGATRASCKPIAMKLPSI